MDSRDSQQSNEGTNSFKKFLESVVLSPLSSKILALFVIITSVTGFIWGNFREFFALIPAKTILHARVWALLTFCFVEKSVLLLVFNVLFLMYLAYHIRSSSDWGLKGFLWLFALNSLSLGIFLTVSTYIIYVLFFHFFQVHQFFFSIFYDVNYSGLSSLIAGLIMVVYKNIPDKVLAGSFRGKHLLGLYFTIIYALAFLMIIDLHQIVFVMSGLVTSWVYLRFFERHADGSQGYSEESFSFKNFFPVSWQPTVDKYISGVVYNLARKLKIIKPQIISLASKVGGGNSNMALEEIVIEGGVDHSGETGKFQHVEAEIEKRIEEKMRMKNLEKTKRDSVASGDSPEVEKKTNGIKVADEGAGFEPKTPEKKGGRKILPNTPVQEIN